uniref:Uncharacterized protein n=1 Tax=Apis cerana TaxID=7461 RepID=V9IM97_APICE
MPRCLMAKKWKAYPWPDRVDDPQEEEESDPSSILQESHGMQQTAASLEKRQHRHEPVEDEEIDVVGDTDSRQVDHQQTCWGPHSPTAGATAPSPPPLNASGALYYHGYTHESWINHEEPPKYATLRSAAELARPVVPSPPPPQELAAVVTGSSLHQPHPAPTTTPSATSLSLPPRKSLSMCFTSTGTALSLPPKKKDIYRPYSLQPTSEIRTSAEEDLSAAQAILDLSASPAAPTHSVFIHTLSPPPPPPPPPQTAPANGQLQAAQLQPPTAQPIPVSVLVPVPSSQTNQLRQQEQTPQPQSPATAETNANSCTGGRDGTSSSGSKTVAYTYEAFFVSDGRSKRRSANTNGAAVPGTRRQRSRTGRSSRARSAASNTRPPRTCPGTSRRTEASIPNRRRSASTAARRTSACRRWPCTCSLISWPTAAASAARCSPGLGCCKAT